MKKVLLLMSSALIAFSISAQKLPQPSPFSSTTQTVGLTDITIEYSRPGVKERTVFGDLVPYGEMWRTGANKATAISFSTPVKINGSDLEAGTYAMFTIPNESSWEIVFSSNTEQWGTGSYSEEEDALRTKVNSEKAEMTETMLFYFDHVKDNSAHIVLQWETIRIRIPVEVNSDELAEQSIKDAIDEAESKFRVYNNAARFYIDNNKSAEQAQQWAEKSVSMNKKYWNLTTLSRAQAANGDYKTAVKTAEEAQGLAEEAKSNFYTNLNKTNIEEWKKKK